MSVVEERRRAIRPLLNERDPADAVAVYYAFYHPLNRTTLVTHPPQGPTAKGYVVLSRTGIDLFRPLVTIRLPEALEEQSALLEEALPAGASVIVQCPADYGPVLGALFDIQREERLRLYRYAPRRFTQEINVLVVKSTGSNGLPRFVIRQPRPDGRQEVVAAAGLNWQSRHFAEIGVQVEPSHQRRGFGRAVVKQLVAHVLASGRTPLYMVAENNTASIRVAEATGFVDTGVRRLMLDAVMSGKPG